jgi:hypothetical protein
MKPVDAWRSIVEDDGRRRHYTSIRGRGGFVRASWDEATEIIGAANAYTIKTHGPDRVAGFSPIPAMSMVSYAAGTRYLSLLGGTCLSFYDWYCDLPPSSPQTWGEQTDVPESADWYNASFLILWGSNVPQTRTPDAHFYTEARRGPRRRASSICSRSARSGLRIWRGSCPPVPRPSRAAMARYKIKLDQRGREVAAAQSSVRAIAAEARRRSDACSTAPGALGQDLGRRQQAARSVPSAPVPSRHAAHDRAAASGLRA